MKRIIFYIIIYIGAFSWIIQSKEIRPTEENEFLTGAEIWKQQLEKKKERRANGYAKYNSPDIFQEFQKGIRTPEDRNSPEYRVSYKIKELKKVKQASFASRKAANGVLAFKSRGPANVPGRTRGLLVMQTDPDRNTWLAGAAGGGIWKTTDAGKTWINLTPDFPTLAVSTLANSDVDPNTIYAGTGEYIASAGTAIEGDGIFKSIDGGSTWIQLSSTVNSNDFISVTRVIVDPNNPDLVLACSAPNVWDVDEQFPSTIMRSEDGGTTWTKVYEVAVSDIQNGAMGAIEQLIATPGNFNVLYATSHAFGVLKSTDAGKNWFLSKSGMDPNGRIELAISPVKPSRIFASAQGSLAGNKSDLYISDDAGATWSIINVEFDSSPLDFLGGQGWYDNTAACDPFDANVLYYGGVSLFRTELGTGSSEIYNYSIDNQTEFLSLTSFSNAEYANGTLSAGLYADTISVQLRFGSGKQQKAHRFLVPEGETSGVLPANYFYQDYVDVPFEVWDITNNRQLMVAFRDQGRDGQFNLIPSNTSGPALEQSREYIYIANIDYNPDAPSELMAENAGHEALNMYFFWPYLTPGATWDPNNLPTSNLNILFSGIEKINASTQVVLDIYGDYTGINQFQTFSVDVHPDQHNTIMIPNPAGGKNFRILLSNDGGVFYSKYAAVPGVNEGDWTFAGQGYITSQFYGADKSPIEERYLGGMQDNGTWVSPRNASASESTNYNFSIGGDGFEVVWHNQDANKLIGGSQYNNFRRSLDGGSTWQNATAGITGDQPFISKLDNSPYVPNVLYTATSAGVFRSDDFGGLWKLTPITDQWVGISSPTFLDVEVSKANANIIWAGLAMSENHRLHVSTDGGKTFSPVNNYDVRTMGRITRLASHPTEDSTAYAVFSFAKRPKILRTTDLGQTWEDISGYDGAIISSTNFPDVAVYCLYVRPDNPDIIWAGTEIGIVESLDNGQSWHMLDDFINASVWQMKGRGNQIVIATHGRGIWTAETAERQQAFAAPTITDIARTPDGKIAVALAYETSFDSTQLFINSNFIGTIKNDGNLKDTVILTGNFSIFNLQVKSFKGTAPFINEKRAEIIPAATPRPSFFTQFTATENIAEMDFEVKRINTLTTDISINSPHNYPDNADLVFKIISPITVSADNSLLSYEDIAIVQPGEGNDYVVVEATLDGLNWIPLITPYDAGFNSEWLALFNSGGNVSPENFVRHDIDLLNFFSPGDKILIRFRLHSDGSVNGWGWAVDDLYIQTEVVGIDKILKDQILLYPNPASDFIRLNNLPTRSEITLVDITGKKIMSLKPNESVTTISTKNLKNGTYMMIIEHEGKKEVKKMIIKH